MSRTTRCMTLINDANQIGEAVPGEGKPQAQIYGEAGQFCRSGVKKEEQRENWRSCSCIAQHLTKCTWNPVGTVVELQGFPFLCLTEESRRDRCFILRVRVSNQCLNLSQSPLVRNKTRGTVPEHESHTRLSSDHMKQMGTTSTGVDDSDRQRGSNQDNQRGVYQCWEIPGQSSARKKKMEGLRRTRGRAMRLKTR